MIPENGFTVGQRVTLNGISGRILLKSVWVTTTGYKGDTGVNVVSHHDKIEAFRVADRTGRVAQEIEVTVFQEDE